MKKFFQVLGNNTFLWLRWVFLSFIIFFLFIIALEVTRARGHCRFNQSITFFGAFSQSDTYTGLVIARWPGKTVYGENITLQFLCFIACFLFIYLFIFWTAFHNVTIVCSASVRSYVNRCKTMSSILITVSVSCTTLPGPGACIGWTPPPPPHFYGLIKGMRVIVTFR